MLIQFLDLFKSKVSCNYLEICTASNINLSSLDLRYCKTNYTQFSFVVDRFLNSSTTLPVNKEKV